MVLHRLALMSKDGDEKDYVVIGEIARLMKSPRDQLLYSRSARDIITLANKYPHLVMETNDSSG